MRIISFIIHFIIIGILTIVTQIGGVIWCICLIIRPLLPKKRKHTFQALSFFILYGIFTFFIIPPVALMFGRTPLPTTNSSNLVTHNYVTIILNRHYATPTLKNELVSIADQFEKSNPKIKTVYLDANFPFVDGFPLLPHLSHNDGKKIDLSFQYQKNGKLSNHKPSRSGYGIYEDPTEREVHQPQLCLSNGHWQYDFPKYLTFGSSQNLTFDLSKTKELIDLILDRKRTQKVFIEPHLKSRMKINHQKLKFHGCQAVRHDDHIHYQIN